MALIKCHECGNEVSTEAGKCPKCGVTPKSQTNFGRALLTVIGAIAVVWYFFGGGLDKQANVQMKDIEAKVASDSVEQYTIAKNQGDKTQICAQAMQVSAAYLQAKDQENYNIWKKAEKRDCEEAGMPTN